jgi:hypothetical protein
MKKIVSLFFGLGNLLVLLSLALSVISAIYCSNSVFAASCGLPFSAPLPQPHQSFAGSA